MPRPRAEQPTYSLTNRGGRWYVQWWEGGAARRVSCRTADEADARRFLASWKAGLNAPVVPESPTVGLIVEGYRAARAGHRHSPTLGYDAASLTRHLGDLPVDHLTPERVRAYRLARKAEGAGGASAQYRATPRPLSDGTLIRELGTLRAALAWAVRERWIERAPAVERPSAPPSRTRWLTREEYDRLLDAAHAMHVRLYIALALWTAARMGALLELTWDRVDLTLGQINLGEGRGKKRRAVVPVTPELRAELEMAAAVASCPFVIEHGGHPVASIKTGFNAAVRRAGLVGVTPHVLRHTAATWMVQRNVPLPMVAAFLGNSVQMVERVYGHASPEWLRQAADALSGGFPGQVGLGNLNRNKGKT